VVSAAALAGVGRVSGDEDSVPPSKMAEARWRTSRRVDGAADGNGDLSYSSVLLLQEWMVVLE